jgi:hypothetical protein
MLFSNEEYADTCFVTGFATVTLLLLSTNIPDQRVFTSVHHYLCEKSYFPSVNRCAEHQVQRNMDEDANIEW